MPFLLLLLPPLLFKIGFLEIHWVDFLDIILVSALLFNFYKLVRGTVALRVFIGFLVLYLLYLVVQATEMELLTAILGQFMGVGMIAVVVLFQQEIKRFLLLVSKTTEINDNFWNFFIRWGKSKEDENWNFKPVLDSLSDLSRTCTGALMVISRKDDLQTYADTGDILDAALSKRLLLSVFFKNSPLHDGAALIHMGRLKAARCILPVSESERISAKLGLRHRAAIGVTEVTDSLVIIVSEETGKISVAQSGQIHYGLTPAKVGEFLRQYFETPKEKSQEAIEEGEG